MITERKIKQLLHLAPVIEPPQGLHDQLKKDLGIQPFEQKPFFKKSILGIPHFANIMLLMLAVTAFGSGIAIVRNMIRWKNWEDVPNVRRQGVNEPIAYHAEDVAPLSQDTLEWLRNVSGHTDQRNQAGEKVTVELNEIMADGTVFDYMRRPAEELFGMKPENLVFYSTFHPNDHKDIWYYNEDGSPLLIKYVKPLNRQRVTETGKVGLTRDRNNPNVNYEMEFEQPRTNLLWWKFKGSFVWRVEKIDQWQWRVSKGPDWQCDGFENICSSLRLPAGSKVIGTKPAANVRFDAQQHPIVTFNDKLQGKGICPPMEVTFLVSDDHVAAAHVSSTK